MQLEQFGSRCGEIGRETLQQFLLIREANFGKTQG
jgi:hypothetical protein